MRIRGIGALALGFIELSACGVETPAIGSHESALRGPGLGNLSYAPTEVFTAISTISDDHGVLAGTPPRDAHGTVAMVGGYLLTVFTSDGGGANGGFAFWDVSAPRGPVRAYDYPSPVGSKLREAHGFGLTTGYGGRTYGVLQSTDGIQIWDFTDPAAAALVKDVDLRTVNGVATGVNAGDYTGVWWVALQAPYAYVAAGSAGLFVVDLTTPTNPVVVESSPGCATRSLLGLGRVNQVQVLGNLLVASYVEDGTGTTLVDISDPRCPVVKRTHPTVPGIVPYSSLLGGWSGRALLASAGKGPRKLSVHEVVFDGNGDPSNIVPYGPDVGENLGNGGYLSMQEGRVHAGFSSQYAKFDIRDPLAFTQVGASPPTNSPSVDQDFGVVLGNLAFVGNDHGGGSTLVVHQATPDRVGPSVAFVSPRHGSTNRNVKSRVGLAFSEAVELSSLDTSTIGVRPLGGVQLAGKFSTQAGLVNFTPDAPLAANTTYEVFVPAGGVKDYVGNANPADFLARFSTGSSVPSVPTGCTLGEDALIAPGSSVAFAASGCSGSGLTYSWDFGDGAPPTAYSASPSTSHAYVSPGHYNVILRVRSSPSAIATFGRRQTIAWPVTAVRPTATSTIAHDPARNRAFVVNTDAGTVASIRATSPFTKEWEVAVGALPRTIAQPNPGGDLWVANQDRISVLDGGNGAMKWLIELPRASRPSGIAFNPAGTSAFVALEGTGRLLRVDAATRTVTGNLEIGPRPRGISVSSDGTRVFVTQLISPDSGGVVREVNASTFGVSRHFSLPLDTTTPSSESDGPGLPNYLQSVIITPDGRGAWVPSKKDNVQRGTGPDSDGAAFTFESRVRTIVSKLDLVANVVRGAARRDVNDSDLAGAVAFNSFGDYAFVATQGSNRVEVYDALSHGSVASIQLTGRAPRGLVVAGNTLFVQNFLTRDVEVFDVATAGRSNVFTSLARVSTQATELLSQTVLSGKKIFYNAADPRMSRDSYTSCASCHLDGDHDGRSWDVTQLGEGVRNTSSLLGRRGIAGHGPVHWTGSFDEVQDVEGDIRGAFGGAGFLSNTDFAATAAPLGPAKGGRSAELDALAAYVSTLGMASPSPFRNADGTMTGDAAMGATVFASLGCGSCHAGAEHTDSAIGVLHDVGTITPSSGKRLGAALLGFDTPSLHGIWDTGPYLHDGSAATLMDVLTTRNAANRHGTTSTLTASQRSLLVAYLQQLEPLPTLRDSLYATQGGHLLRVDDDSGAWKKLALFGAWNGVTTMAALNSYLYLVQGADLKVVDPSNGQTAVVGSSNWSGASEMAARSNDLLVIQGNQLLRVDPVKGTWARIGTEGFADATAMTILDGTPYVVRGSQLRSVNPSTGVSSVIGSSNWSGASELVGLNGQLWTIQGDKLLRVNPASGTWVSMGTGWSGATSMTGLGNSLYVIQSEDLLRVDPSTGSWTKLGTAGAWGGPTRLAALP